MRRELDSFIGCELSLLERDAIDAMKAKTGLVTDANLLRTALYRFACHLDLDPMTSLFAVRNQQDKRAVSNSRRDR